MPDDNADNPYAPPVPVEEEELVVVNTEPPKFYVAVHFIVLVLATLALLFCFGPLILVRPKGMYCASAFLFAISYIGLFFRKRWAYWIVALVSGAWVIYTICMFQTVAALHGKATARLVVNLNDVYFFGLLAILAFICALTCRLQRKPIASQGDAAN